MKRLLACAVALVSLSTACGSLADEVAATVNGHEIQTSKVTKLAESSFIADSATSLNLGQVSKLPGSKGAARQRLGLYFLVQAQVIEDAVKKGGGSVTDEDRTAAEAQIAADEQPNPETGAPGQVYDEVSRPVLVRLLAGRTAFARESGVAGAGQVTPEEVAAYFAENPDEFETTCTDVLVTAEAFVAASLDQLRGGTPIDTLLADPQGTVQTAAQGQSQLCLLPGALTEGFGVADVEQVVAEAKVGEWTAVPVSSAEGEQFGVLVRVVSRTPATTATEEINQAISTKLQQAAQQEATAKSGEALTKALEAADVVIDPRFGSWDPSSQFLITAPPVPSAGPTTTTSLGLSGQ